jgi:hypothetical protein
MIDSSSGSGGVDGVAIASWWECGGMGREDGKGKAKFQSQEMGKWVLVRRTVPWHLMVTVLAFLNMAVQL